jgi:hypothetical protein
MLYGNNRGTKEITVDIAAWGKLVKQHPPQILTLPVRFSLAVRGARWRMDGTRLTAISTGILRTPIDAWEMRREFGQTAGADKLLLAFLNRYGWWSEQYPRLARDYHDLREHIEDIILAPPGRRATRIFLASHMLDKNFTLQFHWEGQMPVPEVKANGIYDALCLTVHIDLLREVEYRKCKRPDCREIYAVTSRHSREYHSNYCAHLESVRRSRRPGKRSRRHAQD